MYNEKTVREWAYDPDRDFIDEGNQDEDLILGLLPATLLLPLIDDPSCPKADYLLRCLDRHLMFTILRGEAYHLDEVRVTADLARQRNRPKLQVFADLQYRRLNYREGAGAVDREQAISMAHDLLNGLGRECEITISAETPLDWTVQLSVAPFHRHREWLKISKSTGKFEFSRSSDL